MQEDKFFEDLVYKMAKTIDKKDQSAFLNLKSAFVSLAQKQEDASVKNFDELKEKNQKAKFTSFGNIEYVKKAIWVDELARKVRDRWFRTSQDDNEKYPKKNLEAKLINNLESKRLGLLKKEIFVSPEAYYEMMTVGYLPEKITKNKKGFLVPVFSAKEPLVLKTKEEFDRFVKQHEKNFLDDIGKRLNS